MDDRQELLERIAVLEAENAELRQRFAARDLPARSQDG
jgi:hypothetical protein